MPLDGRNGAAGLVWAGERVESPLAPDRVKKQLCVGAAALSPLRVPSRGLCLARMLRSGASRTGQMRSPATPGEGIRPTWPRRACQKPSQHAGGRQR